MAGTIANLSAALEHSLYAERLAHRPGLLQSLDPRAKLCGLLLLLFAAGLARSPAALVALYLAGLGLAWASAIPLGFFVRRVWVAVLLFSGIIALPALFITPGPPLWHLPLGLTITNTGARAALFLLLRVGTSTSLAILLVLTTPWNSLLKAMGVLRVPDVVVLLLGMTYRYVELLLRLAGDMLLSRRSRVVGRLSGADERRLLAATGGALLTRSLDLSSEVYLAMQSRGFRGYPRTMDACCMTRRDWVAAGAALLLAATIAYVGR
jgi:cobalt/nickel transport system permease protein